MARYWQSYDYYALRQGCAAAPAVLVHNVSRVGCLRQCTARQDCKGVGYHRAEAACRVYTRCEGELATRLCSAQDAWCGFVRASALKNGRPVFRRGRNRAPKVELRDEPRTVPRVPIGQNANTSAMMALCPNAEFISCFAADLKRRYPVHALFAPKRLPWREPVQNARQVFGQLQRNCTAEPPPRPPYPGAATDSRSFVASALDPAAATAGTELPGLAI